MTTTATAPAVQKPSLKELRAEAQRLGITPELAGCSIDELLRTARDTDDPRGYLAIYAPPSESEAEPPPTPAIRPAENVAAELDTFRDGVSASGQAALADCPRPASPPLVAAVSETSVAVPLADAALEGCYISGHVEVRMSQFQGRTLRRLVLALDARGARLANGRRAVNAADAVRWLLEQIGGIHGD